MKNTIEILETALSKGKVHSLIVSISPRDAKTILDSMSANRKPNQTRIKSYTDAMRNGNWQLSPQGLIFDCEGQLIDGQHRLLAVMRSGTTQDFYCTFNVSPSSKLVLDLGLPRSLSQVGQVSGKDKTAMRLILQ